MVKKQDTIYGTKKKMVQTEKDLYKLQINYWRTHKPQTLKPMAILSETQRPGTEIQT